MTLDRQGTGRVQHDTGREGRSVRVWTGCEHPDTGWSLAAPKVFTCAPNEIGALIESAYLDAVAAHGPTVAFSAGVREETADGAPF